MTTMSYDDRLRLLGLDRLELRRLHADLTTCYKIIHNIVAVPFDSLFAYAANSIARGQADPQPLIRHWQLVLKYFRY